MVPSSWNACRCAPELALPVEPRPDLLFIFAGKPCNLQLLRNGQRCKQHAPKPLHLLTPEVDIITECRCIASCCASSASNHHAKTQAAVGQAHGQVWHACHVG